MSLDEDGGAGPASKGRKEEEIASFAPCHPPASTHTSGKGKHKGLSPFCPILPQALSTSPDTLCQRGAELSFWPCPGPSRGPAWRGRVLSPPWERSATRTETKSPPGGWTEQAPRDSKRRVQNHGLLLEISSYKNDHALHSHRIIHKHPGTELCIFSFFFLFF